MTKLEDIKFDLQDIQFYCWEHRGDLHKYIEQKIPDMWNEMIEKVRQYKEAVNSAPPELQKFYNLRYACKKNYLDNTEYAYRTRRKFEDVKKQDEELLNFLQKFDFDFPRTRG